jgi:hypothetical protein
MPGAKLASVATVSPIPASQMAQAQARPTRAPAPRSAVGSRGTRAGKARFEALARHKLGELDAVIARARQMQAVLEAGLACGCVRLEECELVLGTG